MCWRRALPGAVRPGCSMCIAMNPDVLPPGERAASTSLEISVGCAGGALSRGQYVRVHRDTHAASRIAPFKSSVTENFIEPFSLGIGFDGHRTWHDQRFLQS